MGAPKSVIKIKKKDGKCSVEYVSNVEQVEYYMFELCRGALRDVAKLLKKKAQENFYNEFKKRTGGAGQAIAINTKVWSSKSTKYPRLQIGLSNKGLKRWFFFQEVGTSKTPKKAILTNTAKDNIAEIIKIESQYLSKLSQEASRLQSLVGEGESTDE